MQRQAERWPRSRNRGRPCNSEAARRFTPKAFGAGSAAATAARSGGRTGRVVGDPPSPRLWRTRRTLKTCVSAKRTHRLATDFLVQLPLQTVVTAEKSGKIRWVRFGKRTQIWG